MPPNAISFRISLPASYDASMNRLICTIVLIVAAVSGVLRFGRNYWSKYQAIERHAEAEQDYVERVKREAGN